MVRKITHSVARVVTPGIIGQLASSTGVDQQRPMSSLLLPLLHSRNDGLDGRDMVGMCRVDHDIRFADSVGDLVCVVEHAHQRGDGRSARQSDGLEQVRFLLIPNESGN